ncbi:helix-turn-helix domain-containing protein [uncultured Oscillibacter sp.]|uniref:helix-turn-helix domain-containing protein n=1 Tax=uncultured Oscillibacter sp. TaxID=876091 RepID=UPI0025DAE34F|nr:helix-turn-helix domain-containing protein [uncultured Oscillibacter sp.]
MYTRQRPEPSFRFPQKLARDTTGKNVTAYAKQLALTMFSYASQRTGKVHKTQRELAALSGIALDTVSRKLKELEETGYITVKRHRAKRDPETGRMTRSASEYTCIVPERGFMMIPYRYVRKLEEGRLHGATVAVFLYVLRQIRKDHAYPSFSKVHKETGLAESTVRAALKELDSAGLLFIQRCKKRNGAFSSNSYLPLRDAMAIRRPILAKTLRAAHQETAQRVCVPSRGYADIQNNEDRPKITGVLTREERKYIASIFWNTGKPGQKAGGASSAPPCKTMPCSTFFARESRSGEWGDPPQRGERGEVTFSVSRPSRPALFGSPLSLSPPARPPRKWLAERTRS